MKPEITFGEKKDYYYEPRAIYVNGQKIGEIVKWFLRDGDYWSVVVRNKRHANPYKGLEEKKFYEFTDEIYTYVRQYIENMEK